jgi:hypothetical protein
VNMLLVDLLEMNLGPIDGWPSYILCYLFVDVPNRRIVKQLSAFFFGNELPYGLVWRLYKACNPTVPRGALETIFYLYSMWRKSSNTPHMCEYCNMRIEKFVYVNGSSLDKLELARPEVTMMHFGIEPTGCQHLIGVRLENVRHIQV